ncbi:hypothetical protein [Nocardia transvalensis]|uniref:hypothetical protein n=1 Tax=Nocardia transvalensis TaxID=37333 RepID=UPI001895E937|nr:hypothetical protein [Nocardia transvalensis]MBF6331884.1 hypothetical protein [Nocardia transvalensis]
MESTESIDLWFPLSEVGEIAEHALAADEHSPSISQYDNGDPGGPALVWAKDDGTYVLSNGLPRQLADPADPDGWSKVAFAEGWGRGTGSEIGATPVGGDDFSEHLDLDEPVTGGGTLIDMIRDYTDRDGWMIITVMPGSFAVSFTTDTPA